jgi:TPP-dependent trihydroxycyclohexane-1,2-dione (THcHDO) dehydratase
VVVIAGPYGERDAVFGHDNIAGLGQALMRAEVEREALR